MIDIPYEEALALVAQRSGLSQEHIGRKVEEKLVQLSGLISKEGAIHIVANELGVQLVESVPQGAQVKIKDLSPHSRGVSVAGRVAQKWEIKEFDKNGRKGRVANLLLGDETGVVKLVFWNDQVDVFEELKQGDILVVRNPFAKAGWQGRLELQLNEQSQLQVNPEGVSVEQRQVQERAPREAKYIKDLQGGEENVELIATIVQVYEPRFYDACQKCRRKLSPEGLCQEHGEAGKEVNFNLAAFLDDGTGNIRVSFWKQQAIVLTGKSEQELVRCRDDPSAFEGTKSDLLGEIIKVVGTVKRNDAFDRLEFNANLVFTDVDPAKELAGLEKKFERSRQERLAPEEKLVTVPADAPSAPSSTFSEDKVTEEVISLDDLEEMGR
jgi:ssDNA-binding replication factor A large subunit